MYDIKKSEEKEEIKLNGHKQEEVKQEVKKGQKCGSKHKLKLVGGFIIEKKLKEQKVQIPSGKPVIQIEDDPEDPSKTFKDSMIGYFHLCSNPITRPQQQRFNFGFSKHQPESMPEQVGQEKP